MVVPHPGRGSVNPRRRMGTQGHITTAPIRQEAATYLNRNFLGLDQKFKYHFHRKQIPLMNFLRHNFTPLMENFCPVPLPSISSVCLN